MTNYLWLFLLAGLAVLSLFYFVITLSRDVFLLKKLRKKKRKYILNFSLLVLTLGSLSLIVYLFNILREQIELLQ